GSGTGRERLLAREFLRELAIDRGNIAGALAHLEPALDDARDMAPRGDLTGELETRVGQALMLADRGDEAQAHLLQGTMLAEELGDRIEQSIADRSLARLDAIRGNTVGMEAKLRAAASAFEQLGEVF